MYTEASIGRTQTSVAANLFRVQTRRLSREARTCYARDREIVMQMETLPRAPGSGRLRFTLQVATRSVLIIIRNLRQTVASVYRTRSVAHVRNVFALNCRSAQL